MTSLPALVAAVLALAASPSAAGEVAYSRLSDGFWQVWVYRLANGAQHQVTHGPSDKHGPKWAPDGGIVFRANDDALYRVEASGGQERPFIGEVWPAADPAFAPDGRIAFARPRTDVRDVSAIWLVDVGGRDRRALTRGPGLQVHPAWSRDAAWIVFEHSRGADGSDLRRVSADGATNELILQAKSGERNQKPAFSPDGRWLAYVSSRTGNYEIWALDTASPDHAGSQLTHSPGIDTSPAWSADSRSLVFTSQRRGKLEIWVMRADGTGQHPLFEVDGPAAEPAWR